MVLDEKKRRKGPPREKKKKKKKKKKKNNKKLTHILCHGLYIAAVKKGDRKKSIPTTLSFPIHKL